MGKKSKFKHIRRLASAMPEIMTGKAEREELTGYQLMEQGIQSLSDGTPVDPKGFYKRNKLVAAPLNHNRQMKKQYYRSGASGVSAYMQAVNRHVTAEKVRAEQEAKQSIGT